MRQKKKSSIHWVHCFSCWTPQRKDKQRRPAPSLQDINRAISHGNSLQNTPVLQRIHHFSDQILPADEYLTDDQSSVKTSLMCNNLSDDQKIAEIESHLPHNIENQTTSPVESCSKTSTDNYISLSECTSAYQPEALSPDLVPLPVPAQHSIEAAEMLGACREEPSSNVKFRNLATYSSSNGDNNITSRECDDRLDDDEWRARNSLDVLIHAPSTRSTICSQYAEVSENKIGSEFFINFNDRRNIITPVSSPDRLTEREVLEEISLMGTNYEKRLTSLIQAQSSVRSRFNRYSTRSSVSSDYTPMGSVHGRASRTSATSSTTDNTPPVLNLKSSDNNINKHVLIHRSQSHASPSPAPTYNKTCQPSAVSALRQEFTFSPRKLSTESSPFSAASSVENGVKDVQYFNFDAIPPPVPSRCTKGKRPPFYINHSIHTAGLSPISPLRAGPLSSPMRFQVSHQEDHSEYIVMEANTENSVARADAKNDINIHGDNISNQCASPSTNKPNSYSVHSYVSLPTRRKLSADEISSSEEEADICGEDDNDDDDVNVESDNFEDAIDKASTSSSESKEPCLMLKKRLSLTHTAHKGKALQKLSSLPLIVSRTSSQQTIPKSLQVQYLDLDLENNADDTETLSSSPKSAPRKPKESDKLDYKEIDFKKTEALKVIRCQLESERKQEV